LFNCIFSFIIYATDDRPLKKKHEFVFYFIGFIILISIFIFGAYLFIHFTAHFQYASVFLVTSKFSDHQQKYLPPYFSKELTSEETELIQTHVDNAVSVEGFYQYELKQDGKVIRRFCCANSSLLDYVKVKNAEKRFNESLKPSKS